MMDEMLINQQNERRSYDTKIGSLLNKIESQEVRIDDLRRRVETCCDLSNSLTRRVDKLEDKHDTTSSNVKEHDDFVKFMSAFLTETKLAHASFIEHMKDQKETNKILSDGIAKTTKFQNNLLLFGGLAFAAFQLFGNKLFEALGVLVK